MFVKTPHWECLIGLAKANVYLEMSILFYIGIYIHIYRIDEDYCRAITILLLRAFVLLIDDTVAVRTRALKCKIITWLTTKNNIALRTICRFFIT